MNLLWTNPAAFQLRAIFDFIADDRPSAAERMVRLIRKSAQQAAQMPNSGRPGRVARTREVVVSGTPYVIAYRIQGNDVQVLAVMHAAQDWPSSF